jgi:type IV secretory pathway VirB10-like protein
VWERDAMQLQARHDAALASAQAEHRKRDAQLTAAHTWLAHALADLAERRLEAKALRHHQQKQQQQQQQHMQGALPRRNQRTSRSLTCACVRACRQTHVGRGTLILGGARACA